MDMSKIDLAANRLREDMGGTIPWVDVAESTKDLWRARIREVAEILLRGVPDGDWRGPETSPVLQQRCYDLGITFRHDGVLAQRRLAILDGTIRSKFES